MFSISILFNGYLCLETNKSTLEVVHVEHNGSMEIDSLLFVLICHKDSITNMRLNKLEDE